MGIVYAVLSVTLFSFLILFIRLYREHYQVNLKLMRDITKPLWSLLGELSVFACE